MARRSDNFSDGRQSKRVPTTRFDESPTKFPSPRPPRQVASPQVHERERTRLAPQLTTELEALKADLEFVMEEWHQEMERLEAALGSKGLETLLDHLQRVNPTQARELRAHADELTGVLATAKVLRQLHGPVKVMQDWDAISRELLQTMRVDPRQNVLTAREQVINYAAHSLISAGRAASFSCYLAGVAGATIPSLVLSVLVLAPAGVHTAIMVRDYFRSQELYHKNRAQAFENMGRALRGVESWPACSVDDARAMLAFRDALSRLPERSLSAALDANRARYAVLRDQYFMPANVLASCIGNMLSLVLAPQWSTSLLLGASSVAYFVQGVLDCLQGDAETTKAIAQADFFREWLQNKSVSPPMQQWAGHCLLNQAAFIGMKAHYERCLRELEPELFGGRWREVKGGFNFANGGLSASAATLPAFKLAPKTLSTAAGTAASCVQLAYMAGTAIKVLLRGNVKDQAAERYRQAQLMLALLDPRELLERIANNDGRPMRMEVPGGDYDEYSGFEMSRLEVRPWENEFIALQALAEAIDAFVFKEVDSHDDSMARVMTELWKMKPLDWNLMLRIAASMRDVDERVAFIKQCLAGVLKVDFALKADRLEPELPAAVVVHAFLRRLKDESWANLKQMSASDVEDAQASALHDRFRQDLHYFGEYAFLAALEEVWKQRRVEVLVTTREALELKALRTLADFLLEQHKQFRNRLVASLEGRDQIVLKKLCEREADVGSFVDAVKLLLDAPAAARAERRDALYHLARMKLTQDLLLTPEVFAKLNCHADLALVLGKADIDLGPPEPDDEDLLVSVESSSQSSDSVRVDGEASGSEDEKSPIKTGAAPGASEPAVSARPTGQKLLAMVKRPFLNRRARGAVLTQVLSQLPAQSPSAPPTPNHPAAKTNYTPAQRRETPLPGHLTPRKRPQHRVDGTSPSSTND